MPSANPKITLRASADEIEKWHTARGSASFNSWAVETLNAAANGEAKIAAPAASSQAVGKAPRQTRQRRAQPFECPRARFHRSGTYCKACGITPP